MGDKVLHKNALKLEDHIPEGFDLDSELLQEFAEDFVRGLAVPRILKSQTRFRSEMKVSFAD